MSGALSARRGVTLFELIVVLTFVAVVASMSMLSRRRSPKPQRAFEEALTNLRREAVSGGVAKTARILADSNAALVTALPDGRLIVADLEPVAQQ